jgi:5,6-dimethylbenzimidazole synthase
MDYEGLLSLVKERRSCRRFKPDPIPDEMVNQILEAARWAPSGANTQPWDFIVVKKKEIRQKIVQYFKDFLSLYYRIEHTRVRDPGLKFPSASRPAGKIGYEDAPVYIILCGDKRIKKAYPLYTKVEIADAIFESSLANAYLYMQLAASALDLGSQWVSGMRMWYVQCMIKDLLEIPADFEVYDMFVVGYPFAKPKPRLVRAFDEMVHENRYDQNKFRTDSEINEFISKLRKGRTYSEMGTKRSKKD